MWSELRAERVRREILAICASPLSSLELLEVIADAVDRAVPSDASCWSTFDPATTMVTSAVGRDLDEHGDAAARFFELEYARDTPGQYRSLVSGGTPSVVLDAGAVAGVGADAVGGHLRDLGVGQELRVLLHQNGTGWGGAGLMRASSSGSFTAEEASFLELVAPSIAGAVRASLVRSAMTEFAEFDGGPAVLVFDQGRVAELTPTAAQWIDHLKLGDRGHGDLPAVVGAVSAAATAGRSVAQRARMTDASWVVLRGAPLGGGRAVVTIEPAGPPEVTGLISAALGLTGREIEVVSEVLRGSSTREIAANLHLSAYTVQDHLKAVFSKAGVNSRRELIADVFFGIYAPRLGSAVGPDGFFVDERIDPVGPDGSGKD